MTYLRLPIEMPDADTLARLDSLLRSKYALREGFSIDPTIVDTRSNAVPPWMVVTWLDKVAGDLNDAQRAEMQELRELVGYSLPSVRDIAEASDTFLGGIVEYFGRRASAGHPGARAPGEAPQV